MGIADNNKADAYRLSQPVFLIGFMGAGKSSVARKLARMCNISSLDLDKYIERSEGKKISEIFDAVGEDGFRKIETEALLKVSQESEPMLISCGGGIVTQQENRDILKDAGFVVHLRVDAIEAANRISDTSTRPLFNNLADAQLRCDERMPMYEEASDIEVDTIGKSVFQIAKEIQGMLSDKEVLCQQ